MCVCAYMCAFVQDMCVGVRGQLAALVLSFHLSSSGSCGLNSYLQAWQQVAFPAEPPLRHLFSFFIKLIFSYF